MTATAVTRRRARVRLEGTVQGVGFRPFVHRLAGSLGLAGFVLNDSAGVLAEVEGEPARVEAFLRRVVAEAPPLAAVEGMSTAEAMPTGEAGFRIRASPRTGQPPDAPVSPDTATCEECLRELMDREDRRYRYPFVNCTNCGPRFTIVRGIPYDRPLTTMAGFEMCSACRAEYDDPADRRFHAQPNACPACGPRAVLHDLGGRHGLHAPALAGARDPVQAAARALAEGAIVAVKGIGGYHLACRADDETAVSALRARKHREEKPFAVMVASVGDADRLAEIDDAERALLGHPARPIVLARRRPGAAIATALAPGAPEIGLMLAYTPLHHLLLADGDGAPLVMTSGNRSEEPIAHRDEDAVARLAGIADLVLGHDRPIETRTDDSVLRVVGGRPVFVRRSRGYVPRPLALPGRAAVPLLACGAELKSTVAVARDGRAWVSHHIGDLQNAETLDSYIEAIAHLERLFAVGPEAIAHDLHPGYLSTAYAIERADATGSRLIAVQHHHAHLAACLAEHGESGPAVGVILDGTGAGQDGTVWGGELLVGALSNYRRAGHLETVAMPGGERAVREPWRMACAWLARDGAPGDPAPPLPRGLRGRVPPERWGQVVALARSRVPMPVTSSAGRLFDAIAALAGLRTEITYEGQAAVLLEAAIDPRERGAYTIAVTRDPAGRLVLRAGEAVIAAAQDFERGAAAGAIAARFHSGLVRSLVEATARVSETERLGLVALGGGSFVNRRLLAGVRDGLEARGLTVLAPERMPPGDGGISFGQAAVAAARLSAAPSRASGAASGLGTAQVKR